MTADGRRLDVVLALRRALVALAADFPGVLFAGLLLVTGPGLLTRDVGGDWAALLATLRAVLAMLFVALVSWGAVARLTGHALPPTSYVKQGLARATPGVQVALLAGAAIVAGLTVQLFGRHGTLAGWALDSLLLTAGLWGLVTLMPAVPAAVVERLGPMAAFRRAAALTDGNRDRILAVALVTGLALAPGAALAAGIAGEAGPWLTGVVELLAWSLAAMVPAAVYAGLRETA